MRDPSLFDGKIIVITGGTGSFGSTFVRYLLSTNAKEIRVFSRDEKKQEDMRLELQDDRLRFIIGDVRIYESLHEAFEGADFIFHAAALKQVPSCEFFPMEAVRTNILGPDNVLRAATACKVSRVVVLSTDKAVYPINAMGLSKAMMEKLVVAKGRQQGSHGPIFCATRYGNVMASRGSVIPLFVKQIKEGREITITDPTMTRFLMSLEESVDLVLQAFTNGSTGDVFVQKSPACTIENLAQALQEIFDSTRKIKIIGTRHGEKLYETLVSREEMAVAVDLHQYYRIPSDNRDLNYSKYFSEGATIVTKAEDYTSHNTTRLHKDEVVELLLTLPFIKEQLRA